MMSWFRKRQSLPVAEQIAQLARCGIRLVEGVTVAEVAALPERNAMEAGGYRATLCALGAERDGGCGRVRFLSNDVWFFDSRCIFGPGDYAHVIGRIAAMLPADFPARDPDDSILLEEWRASVSFEMGDGRLHWTQRVLENWLDETLLVRINQSVDQPGRVPAEVVRLWQVPLESQHRLLIAATTANARRLAQECRLAIRQIV